MTTATAIDFSDLERLSDLEKVQPKVEREKYACTRCGGTGIWRGGYTRIVERKCAACNGRGFFYTSEKDRRLARSKRAEKKAAELAANKNLTEKQHPDLIEWLRANTSWNDFARSLVDQLDRKGVLSDKQIGAARRMMDKTLATLARRADEKKAREADATVLDLAKIHELFGNAHQSGLGRPKLRVAELLISEAPVTGRNAGSLYVKDSGEYAGKITPEGKWLPLRETRKEVEGELVELAEDPMKAVVKYGRLTGKCACCGRKLTNKESVELGVGPICRENWGI